MENTAEPLLKVREAARLLRVSPKTVRGWINSGQLYALKVRAGACWRYLVPRDKLLERCEVINGTAAPAGLGDQRTDATLRRHGLE